MSQANGVGAEPSELLVVLRVDDEINESLTGHAGHSYESPPQPREQALTLAQVLLGYTSGQLDGETEWSCPIAGGRRTVRLEPQRRPAVLRQSTT